MASPSVYKLKTCLGNFRSDERAVDRADGLPPGAACLRPDSFIFMKLNNLLILSCPSLTTTNHLSLEIISMILLEASVILVPGPKIMPAPFLSKKS